MNGDQEEQRREAVGDGKARGWSWGMCGAWFGLNEYETAHRYGTSADVNELLTRDGWTLAHGWVTGP